MLGAIAEDADVAREAARVVAAFYLSSMPPELLLRHGVEPADVAPAIAAFNAGDVGRALALTPSAIGDALSVGGTAEDWIEKIKRDFQPAGFDHLLVTFADPFLVESWAGIRIDGLPSLDDQSASSTAASCRPSRTVQPRDIPEHLPSPRSTPPGIPSTWAAWLDLRSPRGGLPAGAAQLWSIGDDAKEQPIESRHPAGCEDAARVRGSRSADRCGRSRRRRLDGCSGARDVSFLIADYSGRALIRLSHVRRANLDDEDVNRERSHSVTLAGTPHGRALAEQEVQIVPDFGGFRVFAPVTSRGEAVGVLELGVGDEPDRQTLATISAGAHALAYIVIANRRFTDLFDWGQRSVPLSLGKAEIDTELLSASYTCEGGQFTLAGRPAPSGDVGGDTFDFSVERDTLHLSMTDAMGNKTQLNQ